ncbi:MAG: peptidase [Gammaproteobacteria bacterium]|nr:peptidase [Gammaproteobacteria bacterium]
MVAILLPARKRTLPFEGIPTYEEFAEGFVEVPVLGWVACGTPMDLFTQSETVAIPRRLARKNTYALRARGDSMKEANILDGDLVIIEQSQAAEHGEKVVVRINQREVTLKTLHLGPEGVQLVPANPSMAPIVLHNADVEVLGIVRGVIRDQV